MFMKFWISHLSPYDYHQSFTTELWSRPIQQSPRIVFKTVQREKINKTPINFTEFPCQLVVYHNWNPFHTFRVRKCLTQEENCSRIKNRRLSCISSFFFGRRRAIVFRLTLNDKEKKSKHAASWGHHINLCLAIGWDSCDFILSVSLLHVWLRPRWSIDCALAFGQLFALAINDVQSVWA